ncbi:MAG TPA: hypothetical protein VNJ08_17795 [Bacteriovoracaceae bacterium]|nr:hypothetical protein [Bacteriovoracaceae bacterium]
MEKREKLILFFSMLIIVVAAIVFLSLPRVLNSLRPHNPNYIGLATQIEGDVKVRFGNSLSWRKLEKRERIYSHSFLFTGPNSTSSFAFLDKSTIKLDANSLVSLNFDVENSDGTVDKTPAGLPVLRIGVLEGKVDMKLLKGSQVRRIDMDQSYMNVSHTPAMFMLENSEGDNVSVLDGGLTLKSKGETYDVPAGSKLEVKGDMAKKEMVPQKMLDEMLRIALENDKRAFEEEKKKREFLNLVRYWWNYTVHGSDEEL